MKYNGRNEQPLFKGHNRLGKKPHFYETSDEFDVVSTLFSLMALLSAELRYTANEWWRQPNSSNGTALKALSRPYIKL